MHQVIRPLICFLLIHISQVVRADIYLVVYATCAGKTGHTGIAVDNYEIRIRDAGDNWSPVNDTVKTHSLTYFDLWPKSDRKMEILKDTEPDYFRLPNSSSERAITVESLMTYGIPHKEGYPCDGLLRIRTSPTQDYLIKVFLDRMSAEKRPFNTRKYNCTDYVLEAFNFITGQRVKAREFIPMRLSSTPNKFYKTILKEYAPAEVLKDASGKVQGTFIRERILYKFLHKIS